MMKKTKLTLLTTAVATGLVLYANQERKTSRVAKYEVDPIFLNRTSPRAMSGAEISNNELMALFEAAGLAPSSYNGQPWRFVFAKRNTPAWNKFLNLLVPFNQSWAKNASALVAIVSRDTFEWNNEPDRTHSFSAGAAWENLALQASMKGLVTHGMAGFDYDRARKELNIPKEFTIEAMFAIGKPAPAEVLPAELRDGEKVTTRKPVNEIAFEGTFKN